MTTTNPAEADAFIRALASSAVRAIALYPTMLGPEARWALYRELEAIPGLELPHVHLRSDYDEAELDYLTARFGAELFNIHPRKSRYGFGIVPARYAGRIYIENVELAPEEEELAAVGGMCVDYAHLENARLNGQDAYVAATERALATSAIGCCHVSAMRIGVPNEWSGGWDHHRFETRADLDYMARYRDRLPSRWISLELENTLEQQLGAARYLEQILGLGGHSEASGST
jgi:hypothetical protein